MFSSFHRILVVFYIGLKKQNGILSYNNIKTIKKKDIRQLKVMHILTPTYFELKCNHSKNYE